MKGTDDMYENRRNRKIRGKRFLIGAGCAAGGLLLTAAGVLLFWWLNRPAIPAPEETLMAYVECLKSASFGDIYDLLNESSRESITREELESRYENIYRGIEATDMEIFFTVVTDEKEIKKRQKGETVAINYTIAMETVAGSMEVPSCTILTYQKEDNRYLMTWDPAEIFPGLKQEYKVKVRTIQAERGGLYDAFQNPLACKGEAWQAGIVPGKLEEPGEESIKSAADVLGLDVEEVQKALEATWVRDDLFVPLRTISKNDESLKEELLTVPGIRLNTIKTRIYPAGRVGSHLPGYVRSITAEELQKRYGQHYNSYSVLGRKGLERAFEDRLRSRDGYEIDIVDEAGETIETVLKKEPVNGEDIRLTVYASMQEKLYQLMDGERGCAVILNPVSGDVLGMVSMPAYDANDYAFGFTEENWEAVQSDPGRPLDNRINELWNPGFMLLPVREAVLNTDASKSGNPYSGLGFEEEMPFSLSYQHSTPESMNILHLACLYAGLYHKGTIPAPNIVAGNGNRSWKDFVYNREAGAAVLEKMAQSVEQNENGLGALRVEGSRIAGYTAELLPEGNSPGLTWVLGMSADKQEKPVLILLLLEDIQEKGGSVYAAEMAGECLREYYRYYG